MLDRISPDEECIVVDIDDWYVQLLQCRLNEVKKKGSLLPTCLCAVRGLAIFWMGGTELAVH